MQLKSLKYKIPSKINFNGISKNTRVTQKATVYSFAQFMMIYIYIKKAYVSFPFVMNVFKSEQSIFTVCLILPCNLLFNSTM